MRKLIYLFSIVFFILQACSSGDSSESINNSNEAVLLKRSLDEGINEYIYQNGNKLSKIVYGMGGYDKFTYSGNLITKVEWVNDKGVVDAITTYSYNSNNKLIEMREYSSQSLEHVSQYAYNSDGTVTINSRSRGSSNGVDQWYENIDKNYFDKAGNLIKMENEYETTLFYYDNKNWPLKNVAGIYVLYQSNNNIIRETRTSTYGSSNTTWTYDYNSMNYPISGTRIENGKSTQVSFSY
jgi:hypothetical protein